MSASSRHMSTGRSIGALLRGVPSTSNICGATTRRSVHMHTPGFSDCMPRCCIQLAGQVSEKAHAMRSPKFCFKMRGWLKLVSFLLERRVLHIAGNLSVTQEAHLDFTFCNTLYWIS